MKFDLRKIVLRLIIISFISSYAIALKTHSRCVELDSILTRFDPLIRHQRDISLLRDRLLSCTGLGIPRTPPPTLYIILSQYTRLNYEQTLNKFSNFYVHKFS